MSSYWDVLHLNCRLSKANCPPYVEGPPSNRLRVWIEQKADTPPIKREFFPSEGLQNRTLALCCLLDWKWNISSSWTSGLSAFRMKLYHQLSQFSGLQIQSGTKRLISLGLHLADSACRSWVLPASIITWINSLQLNSPLSYTETEREYKFFFLIAHKTLSRRDHTLCHKTSLTTFKKT